jgi:hypothetical protein
MSNQRTYYSTTKERDASGYVLGGSHLTLRKLLIIIYLARSGGPDFRPRVHIISCNVIATIADCECITK